ncbi:MAG TPA: S-methyl-5-thioribose-1-phosphate isomerase [Armatimonadota bacterium]|jgi:methylthioribose-1-phosphate isomerase
MSLGAREGQLDLLRTVEWRDGQVVMIDQTLLPGRLEWVSYNDYRGVAEAIVTMKVRGAPAIGVTAALGMALGAQSLPDDPKAFDRGLAEIRACLAATRPTAVNLFWALDRLWALYERSSSQPAGALKEALMVEARAMVEEDITVNRSLGRHGAELIPEGATVLTHCNAGGLATAGYGTALGVIRAAVEAGKHIQVLADETRPRLQGGKLTAWELHRDGIPVTVICDNMAPTLMRQGKVTCAVVGADRITALGDTANKIGTYGVALACRSHGLPFYVAAPLSTVDFSLRDGDEIPIEERDHSEVTHADGARLTAEGVPVLNPSFDVTPAELVSGIITEVGVARAPFEESLKALKERA